MSSVVAYLRSCPSRVIVLAGIAVSAAGCSSESTRFNDNPFRGSPYETTGSLPPAQPAPVARVESNSLPPPTASRPVTVAATPGVSGGGRGLATYNPPASPPPVIRATAPAPEVTGSVQIQAPPPAKPAGHWTWDGGTAVTVAAGETVVVIARRHGVPASAVMQANNIGEGQAIYPGQRLVIPRYISASAPAVASAPRAVAPPVTRPVPGPAHKLATPPVGALSGAPGPMTTGTHIVAHGDTLTKIAKHYGKSVKEIARANKIEPHATLKIGERIVIPGMRMSKVQGKEKEAFKLASAKSVAPPPAAKPVAVAKAAAPKDAAPAEPQQSASVVTPAAETPGATTGTAKVADGAPPSFRWPVKGRVIAGFGPKTNGQQNDGINLAVPEGTPVKASEDGVVAYSGNELKGYGNLVLVRHSNGYVTAYAHAKELLVKRGDHIKRGQVIAKSGQSGNVDGPQLHFEIRKGPTPMDPMPMLSGG
jgi:murein DD-endopeptidase MepM/ murein hydrolase activator NlpD